MFHGDGTQRVVTAMRRVAAGTVVLLALCAVAAGDVDSDGRLLLAVELCRHGDRAPLYGYPNDRVAPEKWPRGNGMLTGIGARAQYELGVRMRERYVDSGFLKRAYDWREVYVRSTAITRTIESAASQMMGLFPPGSAAVEDVGVRFGREIHEGDSGLPHGIQVVPVVNVEKERDALLIPGSACPRHVALMDELERSKEWAEKTDSSKDLMEKLEKVTGAEGPLGLKDVNKISDGWTCASAHGVPLPDGATKNLVAQAKNVSDWLVAFGNMDKEVNRLRAGLLLQDVKTRIEVAKLHNEGKLPEKMQNSSKKLVLFSAHDTTVAATLAAMQVFDGVNPPYNSTVIWELHNFPTVGLTVLVEYNGIPLRLPGCPADHCPLADYLASTHDRTVPSVAARTRECKTGIRRMLAMTGSLFRHKPSLEGRLELLIGSGAEPEPSSSSWVSLLIPVVLIGAFALFATRMRKRYDGYMPAFYKGQDELGHHGDQVYRERTDERPILV